MPPEDDDAGATNAELQARSLAALDWPELLARLSAEAQSDAGRAACLALEPAPDADEARRRMAAVAEMVALMRRGETLPSLGVPDVEVLLDAAEHGEVLGADELRPIGVLCEAAAAVVRFYLDPEPPPSRSPTPEVAALAAPVDPQPALAAAIRGTFDAAGEIRDSVSPTLGRLRRERGELQERARSAIEELMHADDYESVLQDQFFTIRAERYVLPLRSSAKSMGLGIVHDTSRTGETVFIEPTALVPVNNRLKVAELEIKRESRRILEELSGRVAAAAPGLRDTAAALATLDTRAAAARLAIAYDGAPVAIPDEPIVDLRAVRHPLLSLRAAREGFRIVANDVALGIDGSARLLVISGPNAGGKTVLMKSVGLGALMARAGLLVPAAPGSRIAFFGAVLADIGDRQSVLGDLSTFSAHLGTVAAILRHPDPAGAPSMVLLDELMAGTNPEQGAALARATAEALAERAGPGVITTHYDSLKALAEGDARFVNAGMEYDLERLRPTFRLAVGTPGRSYALDIAGRMGLPAALLGRARELAAGSSVELEDVIANLEAREAELVRETERLAEARAALASSEEDQRTAAEALEARERTLARHTREAIEAAVREAREALRAIVREAQRAGSARAAEEARVALAEAAASALGRVPAPPAPPPEPPPPALAPGTRVHVPSLGAAGVVAKAPDARGRVKVTVGAMTIDVDMAELAGGKHGAAPHGAPGPRPHARGGARPLPAALSSADDELALAAQNASNTLDLRGQRGDDALAAVESFLDRAALDGRSPIFLIHGHGTGALRKVVREYLDGSPYVARWAPGEPRQGGDGVSIVVLR
jgi:DNA mismatch repair protein MutS2